MTSKVDNAAEQLEALAQDNEKTGVSDTIKILKDEEAHHEEKENQTLETLHAARGGSVQTYTRLLATLLEGKMMGVEMPAGWTYIVYPTDVGVILELKYGERMFRSAFKATGEEKYDLNAVNTYIIRAENTIDRIMHRDTSENSPRGDNYGSN